MKHFKIIIILSSLTSILFIAQTEKRITVNQNDSLAEIYYQLGEDKPQHYIGNIDSVDIKRGFDLIHKGKTQAPEGKKSVSISKFYSCTSCHNTVREDPDLKVVDQQARLEYAREKNIPYLQGSTFWGIVNRETWYNDDYVLKYGDLVKKAENSLKESVQLCAKVCSQGRYLEDWEMKSILAYFWSLEMKVSDLGIGQGELEGLNQLIKTNLNDSAITFLKSKYLQKSSATFADMPKSKKKGYPFKGDAKNGKLIYELGCQTCHHAYGESDLVLDKSQFTFKWLKKNITSNSHESIYEIIRKGTYSEMGHREYMPLYTQEKMSDQQIEDLRAYIELEAEK